MGFEKTVGERMAWWRKVKGEVRDTGSTGGVESGGATGYMGNTSDRGHR